MRSATAYPYADKAVMEVGKTQTCAECGELIILSPFGDIMTFDTRPNPDTEKGYDILTLHGRCDPRYKK